MFEVDCLKQLTKKEILFFGFTLFSMLFGAGNLIFPANLGNAAGDNVWQAVTGFIISDAGLAILGFIAIANAGTSDILANRVHSTFAFLFPLAIYLAIGPGLAIPRAGSLAYEMGIKPFLPHTGAAASVGLLVFTIIFFSIVFWFAKSPSKLVDRVGKILTPILLILIFTVFVKSLFMDAIPLKNAVSPYKENPVIRGFLDGYQTMDGLCAFIYGIIFTNLFTVKKITNRSLQIKYLISFGLISGILLSICYIIIAYLGAKAIIPGTVDHGAVVLSIVMTQLLGNGGTVLLAILFSVACLSVCIGLVTSCAQYFTTMFSKISYIQWVLLLCVVSGAVANLGLSQILKVSVPILGFLYPIAITLMILGILHSWLPSYSRPVYVITISMVGLFSLLEMINSTIFNGEFNPYLLWIPLQTDGFGWITIGGIGFVLGSIAGKILPNTGHTNTA